jgi:hypothetical protein
VNPDLPRLRDFIRSTLGCGCPDETLQWIECSHSHDAPAHDLRLTRIDVGGTLLVYVIESELGPDAAAAAVPAVVASGLVERASGGFNRLRIVVAGSDPETLRPLAAAHFAASAPRDDRVHLHVVANEDLPFARGSGGQ